jgi:molybdate transport system ATP-binding protein
MQGAVELDGFRVEIDLEVARGETVALLGPNGAGKSTVLRAIAGLTPLERGRIELDGTPWDAPDVFVPPAERGVGAVFQSYRLFDHLDARENVAFGLRARGIRRGAALSAADAALTRLGVASIADRYPGDLSGGQAQRVAVARALVIEPSVVLLDEPMAALDVSARSAVRHELARWLADVAACRLLVSHDPVDAHALADRVVVLEGGTVTQRGRLSELAGAPRTAYIADLVGTNLLRGTLAGGDFHLERGGVVHLGSHTAPDGPAIATIRPAAIALHRAHPEGSPRNVWQADVAAVERGDDRVRVRLGGAMNLVVEVTEAGFGSLGVGVGDAVWASVKASEIEVVGDA